VLLHDCYPLIDQLLWSFSLPEQVYALQTNQAPDKQQRLYLTEDTAVVCLRFTDALMGSLVATRRNEIGPHQVSLVVHAKEARLTVTDRQVELRTRGGRADLSWRYEEKEQVALERMLWSFANSVRAPVEHPLTSSGARASETWLCWNPRTCRPDRFSGGAGTYPAVGRYRAAGKDKCLTRGDSTGILTRNRRLSGIRPRRGRRTIDSNMEGT